MDRPGGAHSPSAIHRFNPHGPARALEPVFGVCEVSEQHGKRMASLLEQKSHRSNTAAESRIGEVDTLAGYRGYLVLGESGTHRQRMSLYGYPRENTRACDCLHDQ